MAPANDVTLLVGTANQHKLKEITRRLEGVDLGPTLRVAGLEILPTMEPVEEDGQTFAENSTRKARAFAAAASRLPRAARPDFVVADDSGLCVRALDGAPGVYSSRYAGPEATDDENNRKLLEELSGVPRGERQAEFVCVMACVGLDEAEKASSEEVLFYAEGRCVGEILFEPRGAQGFGYDPLFFYEPLDRSFAELTAAAKNAVSHRGRALDELGRKLTEHLRSAR